MAANPNRQVAPERAHLNRFRGRAVTGRLTSTPAEKLFYKLLDSIRIGQLLVINRRSEVHAFGLPDTGPVVRLVVHNDNFFREVITRGSLGLGESYVTGAWDVEDDRLCDFIGLLLANKLYLRVRENVSTWLKILTYNLWHAPSTYLRSQRNVEAHYDLGNEFFQKVLDPTLAYSCGYRRSANDSLAQMQQNKYQRSCKKLGLEKGGRLLDIGCGWGGLAIYAAQHYPGLNVRGVTLSPKQCQLARQRVRAAGLEGRVSIELLDYRLLEGSYDFVVSVGMFEHVGKAFYGTFAKKVREVIKQSGVGLLHTIALTDKPEVKPDPWISRYIFPGSRLPRLEEIGTALQREKFVVGHVENWKLHYADTLRHWKNNFDLNRAAILRLGQNYTPRFMRLWNYYLQSCEAGFRFSDMQLYQVLFCDGDQWSLPLQFDFA